MSSSPLKPVWFPCDVCGQRAKITPVRENGKLFYGKVTHPKACRPGDLGEPCDILVRYLNALLSGNRH